MIGEQWRLNKGSDSRAVAMLGSGEMGGGLEIRLLGPVQVTYQGRVLEVGGLQARSVLAVLMLHPGQVVPRGVIVRNAWRGDAPATAEDMVTAYVSRLRRVLAPAAPVVGLQSVRPGFRARIDPALVDAHRFAALLRRADQDRAAQEDELAIARLQEALGLWRGHTLAMEDAEAAWLRSQARSLQDRRFEALERLASLYCGTGRPEHAMELLRAEAPRHPERDGLIALLVQALAEAGHAALAIETADRARDALDQAGLPVGLRLRQARRRAHRPPSIGAVGRLRQLPPDSGAFTGRARELAELLAQVGSNTRPPGAVVISAIDGMAGIGKTALAVHAAHRLASQFPDGQLFVDLHGFTKGLSPRTAMDTLADVLRTLGVAARQIPEDLAARAALYRDRLAGRRILVVLDNASGEQQVRPLLPGHAGCMVLVTSRLRLKGLDDAHVLSLDVLPVAEAGTLLRTVAGPGRILAGDPALQQVVEACGGLPLAVRIAAALLRHRPTWALPHLTEALGHARRGLDGFRDGYRDLSALFDLSYQGLGWEDQRAYRYLGLLPGPDADPHAAAALLDRTPAEAERLLQNLVDHSLLQEHAAGRYQMHDLIRAHARALADGDAEPERRTAITSMITYYQHTALRASIPLARSPGSQPAGPAPDHAPTLPDARAAQRWLRTERANVRAVLDHALQDSLPQAVPLAASLAEIHIIDGPWADAIAFHQAAAALAQAHGDQLGQVGSLNYAAHIQWLNCDYRSATDTANLALYLAKALGSGHEQGRALATLGRARLVIGDYPAAAKLFRRALRAFSLVGNDLGRANMFIELVRVGLAAGNQPTSTEQLSGALRISHGRYPLVQTGALVLLAEVQEAAGRYAAAADSLAQALDLVRDLGHRSGQAFVLVSLAQVRRLAGDLPGALDVATEGLQIYRNAGDRRSVGFALNVQAAVLAATGDHEQALNRYRQSIAINRELGHPDEEATALEGVGECLLHTGDPDEGVMHLRQALDIYRRIDVQPAVDRLTTRLTTASTANCAAGPRAN